MPRELAASSASEAFVNVCSMVCIVMTPRSTPIHDRKKKMKSAGRSFHANDLAKGERNVHAHQTKRARLLTGSMSHSERHECHCGGRPRGPRLMCLSSLGRAQCSVDRVKLGALNVHPHRRKRVWTTTEHAPTMSSHEPVRLKQSRMGCEIDLSRE